MQSLCGIYKFGYFFFRILAVFGVFCYHHHYRCCWCYWSFPSWLWLIGPRAWSEKKYLSLLCLAISYSITDPQTHTHCPSWVAFAMFLLLGNTVYAIVLPIDVARHVGRVYYKAVTESQRRLRKRITHTVID